MTHLVDLLPQLALPRHAVLRHVAELVVKSVEALAHHGCFADAVDVRLGVRDAGA